MIAFSLWGERFRLQQSSQALKNNFPQRVPLWTQWSVHFVITNHVFSLPARLSLSVGHGSSMCHHSWWVSAAEGAFLMIDAAKLVGSAGKPCPIGKNKTKCLSFLINWIDIFEAFPILLLSHTPFMFALLFLLLVSLFFCCSVQ